MGGPRAAAGPDLAGSAGCRLTALKAQAEMPKSRLAVVHVVQDRRGILHHGNTTRH